MIVDIPLGSTRTAIERRQAILDLIQWLNDEGTARALTAINLLALSDADIEAIMGRNLTRRIPHLGPVS
jgi:hypothetical protein